MQLVLDNLHDELKLLSKQKQSTTDELGNDAWKEVGEKNIQHLVQRDMTDIANESIISEIFGGNFRTEFHVEGTKSASITIEPFFILNLEITKCKDLENALESSFNERRINDYKTEQGKLVYAKHKQVIDKLPKILILHLKRFIYKD